VVIGGDYQGLGIARSLGRQKVPVCIIDDEYSISRFSRYTTHFVSSPNLRDEKQAVDGILEIGRRLGLKDWVLFPTRDETVAAFSRYKRQLSEFFRVPTPDWETVKWVWDKRNTYHRANDLGIPIPQTWYPRSLADLDGIDGTPPFAVKPAIKEHFFYATKAKAWRANNAAELRERFQKASSQVEDGEVMIQRLIPGGGEQQFAYCAFFKEGRSIASMVVKRARQHPPEFGRASTYVQTIELPVLEELSERFLRAINYYGLVEMEYKLDLRDNRYCLLDINGRTWGYHSLGAAAGVDFPRLLFEDQLGREVQSVRARPGVAWIRFATDLPVGIPAVLRGQLKLSSYLKSVSGFDTEAVFSMDDPLPGLAETVLIPYLIYKRGF
jgi:predicted ATP-grasp superfamily ATP-dependent carboligase